MTPISDDPKDLDSPALADVLEKEAAKFDGIGEGRYGKLMRDAAAALRAAASVPADVGERSLMERELAAMDYPEHKREDAQFLRATIAIGKTGFTRAIAALRSGGTGDAVAVWANAERVAKIDKSDHVATISGRQGSYFNTPLYTRPSTEAAKIAELEKALWAMMQHSCVADSAPEDKDAEDHAAESVALKLLAHSPARAEAALQAVPEYTPQIIDFEDSGVSELVLNDTFHVYGEEVTVRVIRDAGGRIDGFQWWTAMLASRPGAEEVKP